MAVYTKISKHDVSILDKKYSLGNIINFSGIKQAPYFIAITWDKTASE